MSEHTRDEEQHRPDHQSSEQTASEQKGPVQKQTEQNSTDPALDSATELETEIDPVENANSVLPVAFRQQGIRALPGFLKYLFQQYLANRGTLNAAALTYTTLFAVVPLMTVSYSILSSVPSFGDMSTQLENLIFDHFVPTSGLAVRDHLSQFASQARTLTAVGIVVLVLTAYMMLKTIEGAFNHIWRVKKARKGISSFVLGGAQPRTGGVWDLRCHPTWPHCH